MTALEWVQSLTRPATAGSGQDEGATAADPGVSADQVIFGGLIGIKDQILDALRKVGTQAGLPGDYNWTPALAQAAQQHSNLYGGQLYSARYTNYAGPVLSAVSNAAVDQPGLAALLPNLGPGSDFWNQGNLQRDKVLQNSVRSSRADATGLASVFLAPVAAYLAEPAAAGSSAAAVDSGVAGASEAVDWNAVASGWEGLTAASANENAALAAVAEANVKGTLLTAMQVGSKLTGFYTAFMKAKGQEKTAQATQEAQLVARQQAAAQPAGQLFGSFMPGNGGAQSNEDGWMLAGLAALFVILFGVIAGKGLSYVR